MEKNRKSVFKGFFAFIVLISIIAVLDSNHKLFKFGSERTNEETFFGEIKEYSSGNASLERGSIKEIEINWQAGGIEIREYDGEKIIFSESADNGINSENEIKYLAKNGKLIIRYNGKLEADDVNKIQKKNLILMVPQEDELVIREIKINSVYSDMDIATENIKKLKIDSTNGEIKICGSYKDIEVEEIAGNILMDFTACPDKLKSKTVRGDIKLEIPENRGFAVEHHNEAGVFDCDFELTSKNEYSIYKWSKSDFELTTANGNIDITKAS